jgi:hypothetical protein
VANEATGMTAHQTRSRCLRLYPLFGAVVSGVVCWHFLLQGIDKEHAFYRFGLTRIYLVGIGPLEILAWIVLFSVLSHNPKRVSCTTLVVFTLAVSALNIFSYFVFSGLAVY